MRITQRFVDGLRPDAKATIHWDSELPGFGVRAAASERGHPHFVVDYRVGERRYRKAIGAHGVLTVEQARKRARGILAKATLGVDALAAMPVAVTVAEIVRDWAESLGPDNRNARYGLRALDRHVFPTYGQRPVESLTRADIAAIAALGAAAGATMGIVFVRALSAAVNRGIRAGAISADYRFPSIRLPSPVSRDRFASGAEVARILPAIAAEHDVRWRAYFAMLLLTACRKSELLGLRWSDVDPVNGVLAFPCTKSGRPHHLPLTERMRQVLAGVPQTGPYAFGGHRAWGSTAPTVVWDRITARAASEDLTIHDCRRTVASWAAQASVPVLTIKAILNHASGDVTSIYARLNLDAVRAALDTVAAKLEAAAGMTLAQVVQH